MIDQVTIPVSDLAVSKRFYDAALAPLEYRVVVDGPDRCGFSVMQKPDFWLRPGGAPKPAVEIAFMCRDREVVDLFHAAATAAGAIDRGAPAERSDLGDNSYAATVLDPDGNTIEAVCHRRP